MVSSCQTSMHKFTNYRTLTQHSPDPRRFRDHDRAFKRLGQRQIAIVAGKAIEAGGWLRQRMNRTGASRARWPRWALS
jgi:hypothetical protein